MENYLILKKDNENSLVTYVKRRLTKENRNFLPFFSGSTGSGKTYSALEFARQLDPDFCADYIVFDFEKLIVLCTDKEFNKKKIKVILFEEAQISQSSSNWQSKENRLMNMFLSTFRHQNICVIFTSPFMDFVDSKSRKLIHMELKMSKILKKEKKAICIPRFLQWNPDLKKMYFHMLRILRRGMKGTTPIHQMIFNLPPKELLNAYEGKKKEFTDALNLDIKEQLEALREAKKPVVIEKRRRLTDRQEEVFEMFADGMTQTRISEKLGCSRENINTIIRSVEKKGYTKKEFMKEHEYPEEETIIDKETPSLITNSMIKRDKIVDPLKIISSNPI